MMAYWFVLNQSVYANQRETKIAQIAKTLSGEPAHGGVVALSMEVERRELARQQAQLSAFIEKQYASLSDDVRLGQ